MATTNCPTRIDFESPRSGWHEMVAVDTNHRQIGVRIFSDQARFEVASVRKRNSELAGPMHDVAVGQDKAIRGKDEAGAAATHLGRTAGRGRLPIIRMCLTSILTTDGLTFSAAAVTAAE